MDQTYMGLNSRSLLLSALVAGVGMGLLSSLPLLACVNCLFFAWVWGGGIAAVALYRRNENQPYLSITQGLVIGAAAGIVGGLVGAVASALLGQAATAFSGMIRGLAGEGGEGLIPNLLLSGGFSMLGGLIKIILYTILGAVGGLIATTLIWKTPTAPLPPPPAYNPPPQM